MSEIAGLAPALRELERTLGPLEGEPAPLDGGLTNRNVRARLGGRDLVLRICGRNAEVVSIDRETEMQAQRAAHAAGVAPAVVARLRAFDVAGLETDVLVTEYAPGRALEAADVREPATLTRIAVALRAVHGGPPLPTSLPTFTLAREYSERARAAGGGVAAEDEALAVSLSERIANALSGHEHTHVPCHNDLLPANFLLSGASLAIIDWEYAGMNDRYFDLGNLAVNSELSGDDELRLLEAYFDEPPTERRIAALRLMRLMSDVREALWGSVQDAVSELDFDYAVYAGSLFARLRARANDERLEEWLHAAAA